MTWPPTGRSVQHQKRLILLLVRADGLSAFGHGKNRLMALAEFPASPEGHSAFYSFVSSQPDNVFLILADTDDESTVPAWIPKSSGKDRQALIERKHETLLPEQAFRTDASLGWLPGKPRREKLLLASLTRPALLQPWLDNIDTVGAALAGIHAPGQLDEYILAAVSPSKAPTLLVTCHDDAFRQSLLIGGRRHYSRTSRLPPGNPGDQAFLIHEEAERLLQYLATQETLPPGESPKLVFIAPMNIASAMAATSGDTRANTPAANVIDRSGIAAACGLSGETPWREVCLALLARHRPKAQFARRELLQKHLDRRRSRILNALAAGLLVAGGAVSTWMWLQANAFREEQRLAQEAAESLEKRYAAIAETFPKMEMAAATVQSLQETLASLQPHFHPFDESLASLSLSLTDAHAIRLTRILWQATDPARPEMIIEGTVALDAGGYRRTQAAFDAFLAALKIRTGLIAKSINAPLDFAADKNFGSAGSPDAAIPFKLRLESPPRR